MYSVAKEMRYILDYTICIPFLLEKLFLFHETMKYDYPIL